MLMLSIFRCGLAAEQVVRTNEFETVAKAAIALYTAGDFKNAIPLFVELEGRAEKEYGVADTNTAVVLAWLGLAYGRSGDYANAEQLLQRCLKICEGSFGPEHSETAAALNNLADLYRKAGAYARAKPLFQRSLKIAEKTLRTNDAGIAAPLNGLALLYCDLEDYSTADRLFQRSLEIHEKSLGPDHPNTAVSLNNLAMVRRNMGQYAAAELLLLRSLKICETNFGSEHPDTAATMNSLATVYQDMADYEKAQRLFERNLSIREKTLGPEHPDTAESINNLALLYWAIRDCRTAKPLFERSLRIYERVLGPENPVTAKPLNNLAILYQGIGDYANAEALFSRGAKIIENGYGRDHPKNAEAQHNLAVLYYVMGDYGRAEPLLRKSLVIFEKAYGKQNTKLAFALNNLGGLYSNMGDYSKAKPLFERSLKMFEDTVGPNHPDTAGPMNNLALLYCRVGNPRMAKPLLERSLGIRVKAFGAENPKTALALNNLAEVCHEEGDYTRAERLYRRSLEIYERVLGMATPDAARVLRNSAWLELDLKRPASALLTARTSQRAQQKTWQNVLSFASEPQRIAFQRLQDPFSLLANLGNARDLAEVVLRNKGVVLDSLLEDQIIAEASRDPHVRENVLRLHELGCRLLHLETELPKDQSKKGIQRHQAECKEVEAEAEALQKALAQNLAISLQTRRALSITVPQVQEALPKNSLLLEFVMYTRYLGAGKWEPGYGVVLIGRKEEALKQAGVGEPVWVPLGAGEEVEKNLREYVALMRAGGRGEPTILQTLYDQLWAPIERHLPESVHTVIISPDAKLNFLSFATLVGAGSRFLAERYTIEYVASGRDLVFGPKGRKTGRCLVAFGNPAFSEAPRMARGVPTNTVELVVSDIIRRACVGLYFAPLPGSEQEAIFLKTNAARWKLPEQTYLGRDASEAEVRALHGPYLLHFATHGFFLPSKVSEDERKGLLGHFGKAQRPVAYTSPMQRSGLAFAGAQLTLDAWQRGETPDPENDGILMAQEVGTMDLKGTWLVVLSACDTGVGEARAGEGVLGLRRGFIQAGAQNLMMTLWPVSDRWTMDLMRAFYERAIKTGDAPMALAEVQREFLVKLREQKGAMMAARLAGPFVMTFQGETSK
jgi:tetratricopeptide (TPR) repeat protein/CHAT domain-containing protein